MKSWTKGFLGGVVLGGIGAMPLVWWLTRMQVSFHCPNCDAILSIHKESRELTPRVAVQETNREDEEDEEHIAAAPTV